MAIRSPLPLVLAIGVSACTCAPAPQVEKEDGGAARAPPSEPPRAPGIRGQVALGHRGAGGANPVVDVELVPEAAMVEFVAARLQAAHAALDRLADARERTAREARAALAENDRTEQEWRRTVESDLRRRVQVVLRRPTDPAEVQAVHADLVARKNASHRRVVAAGKRSLEKERAAAELEGEASRFREARYFAQGLPRAVQVTRSDASGSFSMDAPAGRYALVALVAPGPGEDPAPGPAWLLWIEVRDGAPQSISLDAGNQHGTDCDACVVTVKELR